jgi:hypothetical protein
MIRLLESLNAVFLEAEFWDVLSFRKSFENGASENFKGGRGVKCTPVKARHSRQSTLFKKMLAYCRLLAGSAGIHVDFHADRHFDDLRCFPGHFGSP